MKNEYPKLFLLLTFALLLVPAVSAEFTFQTSEQYQEDANATSWSATDRWVYQNYTKPPGALSNTRWSANATHWFSAINTAIQYDELFNQSVEVESCWNADPNQVAVRYAYVVGTSRHTGMECLNETDGWSVMLKLTQGGGLWGAGASTPLATFDGDYTTYKVFQTNTPQWESDANNGKFYEEAIYWAVPSAASGTECGNLTVPDLTYTLTSDVTQTGTGTCFDVQADNVNLDCQGNTIFINGSGAKGINVGSSFTGVTINNCNFEDVNDTITSVGIFTNEALTVNNTFINFTSTFSTSVGISMGSVPTNDELTVRNSEIHITSGHGISTSGSPNGRRLVVEDSEITINGGSGDGIVVNGGSLSRFFVDRNTINNFGTGYGIRTSIGSALTFGMNINDNIVNAQRNIVEHTVNSATFNVNNNVFSDTGRDGGGSALLTLGMTGAFGALTANVNNNTFIKNNESGNWFFYDGRELDEQANLGNNTFLSIEGSIKLDFVTQGASDIDLLISRDGFDITENLAFANTTAYPYLNSSATVTLNAPPFASGNGPFVDFGDTGTFVPCTTCTIISGTTPLMFIVTGWTSYMGNSSSPFFVIIPPTAEVKVGLEFAGVIFVGNDSEDGFVTFVVDNSDFTIDPVTGFLDNAISLNTVKNHNMIVTINDTSGLETTTAYQVQVLPLTGVESVCVDSDISWQDATGLAGLIMVILLVGLVLGTLVLSFTGIINIGAIGETLSLENAPSVIVIVGLTFLVIATMSFLIASNVCVAFGAFA